MYNNMLSLFSALIFALFSSASVASSVELIPSSSTVGINAAFTVDLFMDADDAGGPHPGVYSGSVTIDYDPSFLTFDNNSGYAEASGTSGLTFGTTEVAGETRNTISVGFSGVNFGADPDEGVIGIFTFMSNTGLDTTDINIKDTSALLSFINSDVSNVSLNEFFPDFVGTSVAVVPVPAAAWLMFSGLGLLGFFSRRS